MSYNRAYTEGQQVKIDQGVLIGVPTLGPCTVDAIVFSDSNAAEVVVWVIADGIDVPMQVYKDRVEP